MCVVWAAAGVNSALFSGSLPFLTGDSTLKSSVDVDLSLLLCVRDLVLNRPLWTIKSIRNCNFFPFLNIFQGVLSI